MQSTSDTYKAILDDVNHWTETKIIIDGTEYLKDEIISCKTTRSMFGQEWGIGQCPCAQVSIKMLKPPQTIPRMASIDLYIQLCNKTLSSEWLPKGKFLLDTRKDDNTHQVDGYSYITLTGYDRMILTEGDCPGSGGTDINVVREIATSIGVSVDSETVALMTKAFSIPTVQYYSGREILGYIASMYGGNFIITDKGTLKLVTITSLPETTHYLVTSGRTRYTILVGGDRILV